MRSLVFLFLFPVWTGAASPDDLSWRALLHFEGNHSHVLPGSPFFLSPEGHQDPGAELTATEDFLRTPEGPCRYPARAIFLGVKPNGPGPLCERWEKWRQAVSAEGIELVFAAAYLNSPSSMYGHTLLKFPRTGRTELLDYTLSYGAETGNSGGAAYVWRGLTGGFNGRYATAPFYLKVKEYNFVENRDFWVYPLRLSEKELALLVAHAWELREVDLPYYFLRRNCAYYLLEFLAVARPGLGLTESFPLWAIPMDTIRRLEKFGLLGEPSLRPSRQKTLAARKATLLAGEADVVERLLESPTQALPTGREALLLDAAYELGRYLGDGSAEELLPRRSSFPPVQTPVIEERPPHLGHRSSRVMVKGGASGEGALGEIAYRAALHDILAEPLGFEARSELSMGDFRARVDGNKFYLHRADILRIRSLAPKEKWFSRTAWSFRLGFTRADEMACAAWRCSAGVLEGGGGWSFRLGTLLFFALGELGAEGGAPFAQGYRLSAGPRGGVFVELWPGGRALLEGNARFRLLGEKRVPRGGEFTFAQSVGSDWEIRLEARVNRGWREGLLGVGRYF